MMLGELFSFYIDTPNVDLLFSPESQRRVQTYSATPQDRLDSKDHGVKEANSNVRGVTSGVAISFWHLSCVMTLAKCEL